MTSADLLILLPLIILGATAVVIMLAIAARRSHGLTAAIALVGLAWSFAALRPAAMHAPSDVTPLLVMDHYALFFMGLLFAAAFVVVLLAFDYFSARDCRREEFYLLVLLATFGASVLVAANHFASFFLGLEILSVSLYAMIAYVPARTRGVEAAVKYLVLAAVSAALLLFGMALVYFQTGSLSFGEVAAGLGRAGGDAVVLAGLVLMIVGIGFKLGLVPFHLWTPDVYEGAPAPVTAFVATVSKGAVFALLLRLFSLPDAQGSHLATVFALVSIASMFAGNLLALLQNNVKRMLAYSSIAHLGYLLVAFLAAGSRGPIAVTFYLVAYFVTTLGAFGVIAVLSGGNGRDADRLEDYRGLARRRPVLAGVFTAMLLSLAGIPLTAGFIGKFYILAAGAGSALWAMVIIMVIASATGLYYYLRVIIEMYKQPAAEISGEEGTAPFSASPPAALSLAGGAALAALLLALVYLGVYPGPLLKMIAAVVADLA